MAEVEIVLKCTDVKGNVVVFEKSNYDKHKRKHPELEQDAFFPDRVRNALAKPTLTVPGYKNNAMCYYFEEYTINGIIKYTKVVIHNVPRKINGESVYCIKTSHKADHIQESKYSELKIEYY